MAKLCFCVECSSELHSKEPEPCIICNKEARDKMPPDAIEVTEELIADMPIDVIPGVACWNCYGSGSIHDGDPLEKLSKALSAAKV